MQLASVQQTQGDYRILAIPKTDRSNPGRDTGVDLEMPKSNSVEDLLVLKMLESRSERIQSSMAAVDDLKAMANFGQQPLGLIANGLG